MEATELTELLVAELETSDEVEHHDLRVSAGYEESDFFVTTGAGDKFVVAVMKVSE